MFKIKQRLLDLAKIQTKIEEVVIKSISIIDASEIENKFNEDLNIKIIFKDKIVPRPDGTYSDTIIVDDETFYRNFDVSLATYCSVAYTGNDFNPSNCYEGSLLFDVSVKWLVNTLNTDEKYFAFGSSIESVNCLSDLLIWLNECTHTETEYLYHEANICIKDTYNNDCIYCAG